LIGVLAGIGVASIALFGRNTAFTIMDFVKDLRKDGFATTTAARVTTSEITIDTKMVPLPNAFWQDPQFTIPAPDLFEKTENSSQYVALATPPPTPPAAPANTPPPTATPVPTPEPKPSFDPKRLRQSLHNNLASVFTGDLPYLLLKSGDRLYPGSRLTSEVTLEAITPDGVLCATPMGILKINPKPETGENNTQPTLEEAEKPALPDESPSGDFSIPQQPQT
jgi:hypothetical protein